MKRSEFLRLTTFGAAGTFLSRSRLAAGSVDSEFRGTPASPPPYACDHDRVRTETPAFEVIRFRTPNPIGTSTGKFPGLANWRALFTREDSRCLGVSSQDPQVSFACQLANIPFVHRSGEHTGASPTRLAPKPLGLRQRRPR